MIELWLVTFIWALSYNFIGQFISPFIDPYFAVFFRSAVGLFLFLPLIRRFSYHLCLHLVVIGMLQFGITYLLLYQAYAYLSIPEILLFTITTPIFVSILNDCMARKFSKIGFFAALISVLGALIIRYEQLTDSFLHGFLLLQCANFTFACGQIYYRRTALHHPHIAQHAFAYFFMGACLINGFSMLFWGNFSRMPIWGELQYNDLQGSTWLALIFVSVLATGLGQFLWCVGAKKVTVANLAVMNNAVIPIGIVVNLLFWQKPANHLTLLIGGTVMLLALCLNWFYPRNKA